MNCRKFKPDVFGSVLICFTVIVVVLASLLTESWIVGKGNVWNATHLEDANIKSGLQCNYGLFHGEKTTIYGRTSKKSLTIVCDTGVCMYSCGTNSNKRRNDLHNLLESNITMILSTVQADIAYCQEEQEAQQENIFQTSEEAMHDYCLFREKFEENKSLMLGYSMFVTVLLFLILGLFMTIVNIILTIINTCHNPVSAVWGVDGLVVCNFLAGIVYFLVMVLWGAEFNSKMKKNLGISSTIRPCGVQWKTDNVRLGFSYWILILCIFLHLGNATLLGMRQYQRYYSTRAQRARSLKLKVADDTTTTGTVMMF